MEKDKLISEGLDENKKFSKGNQLHKLRENVGRPRKLTRFLEAFKCVLELDQPESKRHRVGRAIIHTDKDLLEMTNRLLDEKDRISTTSWESWKRGDVENMDDRVEKELSQFRDIYLEALKMQRDNLFDRMTDKGEARSWGRWAWIIERKFDDWNLRKKSVDETPDRKQLLFRVAPESTEGE
jgi:hypothetical protein